MNFRKSLDKLGLGPDNAIVIGSGILEILGIRESKDIDLVVDRRAYDRLESSGAFEKKINAGREVLVKDIFEIGVIWGVLGEAKDLAFIKPHTVVIDNVRYITPEFLLAVKKTWVATDDRVREKDKKDIELIGRYLTDRGAGGGNA